MAVYEQYEVKIYDNIAIVNMDGNFININEQIKRNFKSGDVIYYKKYPTVKGINFSIHNRFVLEKNK